MHFGLISEVKSISVASAPRIRPVQHSSQLPQTIHRVTTSEPHRVFRGKHALCLVVYHVTSDTRHFVRILPTLFIVSRRARTHATCDRGARTLVF